MTAFRLQANLFEVEKMRQTELCQNQRNQGTQASLTLEF